MSNNNNFNHTINGECSHCGACCQNTLPLNQKEIDKIKNYIGRNNIAPINRHNILSSEYIDVCPFFDKDTNCMIYEVRPEICRWFSCATFKENTTPINHRDKKIVNMLLTFLPNAYCPNAPDTDVLNKQYYERKRKVYGI